MAFPRFRGLGVQGFWGLRIRLSGVGALSSGGGLQCTAPLAGSHSPEVVAGGVFHTEFAATGFGVLGFRLTSRVNRRERGNRSLE